MIFLHNFRSPKPFITTFFTLLSIAPTFINAAHQISASSITSSSTPTTTTFPSYSSPTACNNSPLLCPQPYNNITHLGAHDIPFLRDSSTSFSLSGNQFYNATIALSAGVRLLQAQVHNLNGVLELCHTSCSLLDAGSLESWLEDVKTWMDGNPNDVVTLLLVNSDGNSISSFGTVFQSSGIAKYGYTPPTASAAGPIATLPTLASLIAANTRLVTFIASLPTTSTTYPYLLSEFDFVFETPFSVTTASPTTSFNCTLDRPASLPSASSIAGAVAAVQKGYMGLVNHFLDTAEVAGISIPDVTDIQRTNSPQTDVNGKGETLTLGGHAEVCRSEWAGGKPTFLLVDFWNVGPAMDTVDSLNELGQGDITGRVNVSDAAATAGSMSGAAVGMTMGRGRGVEVMVLALVVEVLMLGI